jgi:hypothetical protein
MGTDQDRTVTVLGAGVAGLAAAWELERLGYRVEVLEGSGPLALGLFAASILLSLVVGFVRGRYTRIWREGDTLYAKGTTFTVTLFLLMVAAKFGLGTVAYFAHVTADGGLGEVLVMIAVMVAVQAECVWRRAQALLPVDAGYATVS